MTSRKFAITSLAEMSNLATSIAGEVTAPCVIALNGSLGVGKSFFAREFINALSANKINVPSPTFNLVYSYKTKKGEVFHFDLYRLKNAEELENIGFFDAIKNGISLIEWPEIAEKFLPKNHISIKIENGVGENRNVEVITN